MRRSVSLLIALIILLGASLAFADSASRLQNGDSGSAVVELQQALQKLGYFKGKIDGKFGTRTENAVRQFQRKNRLSVDGIAGRKTLERIYAMASGTAESTVTAVSAAQVQTAAVVPQSAGSGTAWFGGSYQTIESGQSGARVLLLQSALNRLGYALKADGKFGKATLSAVIAYQRSQGLSADGKAGRKTLQRLEQQLGGTVEPMTVITPADPQAQARAADTYLALGSSGTPVRNLQTALKNLGYSVSVNGKYDAQTQSAVQQFQTGNRLYVDGIAGPNTLQLLYSGNAVGPSIQTQAAQQTRVAGPDGGQIQLLHWFNDVKPALKNGQVLYVYDPASGKAWHLRVLSRGRHCDAEPLTAADTQVMVQAFGNKNTWDQRAVFVRLPDGRWTVASTHDMPHLSGSIKDNNFNGHLCVHFLRDMAEAQKNDPNYGVSNQKTIRAKWKQLTGITVE